MGEFFTKIKETKGIKFIALGIAAGLLLIIIGSYNIDSLKKENVSAKAAKQNSDQDIRLGDYNEKLEEKLKVLIGGISGAGSVSVMVAFESGREYIYAQDQNGVAGTKHVIIDGASADEPVLIKEISPKISGIAVVCKGAAPTLKAEIIELVCTLFSLSRNRVYVVG